MQYDDGFKYDLKKKLIDFKTDKANTNPNMFKYDLRFIELFQAKVNLTLNITLFS